MATIKEIFIEAMVTEQEFVTELDVINNYEYFDDTVQHPFTQAEETKLCDLFEHANCMITEDMIYIVLSCYTQSITYRLKKAGYEKIK